jgi:hypothetical protein
MVFLGDNCLLVIEASECCLLLDAEAKYHIVANGVIMAYWLRRLHQQLHSPLRTSTLVYFDNKVHNPAQHTKHIEIDLHFTREKAAIGDVHILHVSTMS